MHIWKTKRTVEDLNSLNKDCIHEVLGIKFTKVGNNYLEATMPVDKRTHNPIGSLHGGASVVLAESLGSVASVLVAGPTQYIVVGIEVSASHLSSVHSGKIVGRATPIRLGKSHHVWEVEIFAEDGKRKKVSHVRLTTLLLKAHFKESNE